MKKILLSICTIAMLASCDKNEVEPMKADNGNKTETLSVSFDICKTNEIKTRAAIADFPANSEVGIFATSGALGAHYDGTAGNSNVKATLTGASWTLTPAIYLSNANATLFAYYPYAAANNNGTAIPVEHTTQTDFLYGTHDAGESNINNANANVRLEMKHALSLLQFKLSKTNYTGAGKLTKIEVANATGKTVLNSAGTMNTSTGTITPTTGKNESAVVENAGLLTIPNTVSSDESTYPKVMVLPVASTAAGDLEIHFTIDGKIYTWNVAAATIWAKGTKNTYTVTINGTAISVGNITITDWTDGVNGSISLQ